MPETTRIAPPDFKQRLEALDITRSCIVQAPAGSGKTELLTTRFLALLAVVDQPEEILAITFTRAATAEMRNRILNKLEAARCNEPTDDPEVRALALAALAHAERRGWQLLEQPHRLNIQTIDSLCLRIAHGKPLLSRLGGALQPTENAGPIHQLAARRTLQQLGGQRIQLNEALRALLSLRDMQLADCERLIAGMLEQRDQWAHVFPLAGDVDWDEVRAQLEVPFQRAIRNTLAEAHRLLSIEPTLVQELIELANHACQGTELNISIGLLSGTTSLPPASLEFLSHWGCLCEFVLTKEGEWRKTYNKTNGFVAAPRGNKFSFEKQQKDRIVDLVARLGQVDGLLEALCDLRSLPPPRYTDQQWQLVRHFFTALTYATAELQVAFAETNSVDFIELGMAAATVLSADGDTPTDLALALSERITHLLVDEFQDTSRQQHRLLSLLIRGWSPGDGRTCFLVGDPMQSIYMFRQAEVELFREVRERGLGDQDLALDAITLTANFRSHAGLVVPLNELFPPIFASGSRNGTGSVDFTASTAVDGAPSPGSYQLHATIAGATDRKATTDDTIAARRREADAVVDVLRAHLDEIAHARAVGREYRVAVLARAKSHLALIAQKLRDELIPFRAVELETLSERQEIRDLLSLVRALLHPMDRVAWLSVLRAPWCGLTLSDLHRLCGSDADGFRATAMLELLDERVPLLSLDGQSRAERTYTILRHALSVRYQQPSFSTWIERTWTALGGALCVDATGYENAQVLFRMLDTIPLDGTACMGDLFEEQLNKLFAQPDSQASERHGIQLLTIHKAKGLGFDVVIVPGLERLSGSDQPPLICWLERPITHSPHSAHHSSAVDEILIAPVGSKGEMGDPLYKWVRRQKSQRESEERKRLMYVACTRARSELHLFGTAVRSDAGLAEPRAGSLLATAWPGLRESFVDAWSKELTPFHDGLYLVEKPLETQLTLDLAAAADSPRRLILHRLPTSMLQSISDGIVPVAVTVDPRAESTTVRPHGSRLSRAVGSAVHALLEQATHRLSTESADVVRASTPAWRALATALLQSSGALPQEIDAAVDLVLKAVENSLTDPLGRWVLGPHTWGLAESSWTGWQDGALRTLRADRIFRAGRDPLSEGSEYLWIVDYKTSEARKTSQENDEDAAKSIEEFFSAQQSMYAQQLTAYAEVMQLQHGRDTPMRLALYFPRLQRLHHWDADL